MQHYVMHSYTIVCHEQTDAWIVTGGTNAGVMKFVGEAVSEYMQTQGVIEKPIVALGIATWGIVDNKAALVDQEEHDVRH